MASFIYSIPSTDRTVTRPMGIKILKEVLRVTDLNPKDFRVKLLGASNAEKIQNGYLNEEDDKIDNNPNRLSTDKVLTLEIENTIVGDGVTPVRYHDHTPIFTDKNLKVMVRPIYSEVETRFNVILSVRDKVEANNWLQEVKRKIYQGVMTNYHDIDYYYIVPHTITKGLYNIHTLREKVAGYGEDFGHYLKNNFVNNYDIITDVAGGNHIVVIREKQTNIFGFYDFDHEPEQPEKNDDNAGGWNIRFTYTIQYQRPDSLVFDYPLLVHNQLLPDEMINFNRPDHYTTHNGRMGLTQRNAQEIVIQQNKHGMKISEGIPDPLFDDWVPPSRPERYIQLSRTMIGINSDDLKTLIDIPEFADSFDFKPNIQRWFKLTKDRIFFKHKDLFYFVLYNDTKILHDKSMTIDDELMIYSKEDLDLRQMYHICVWVLTDISLLSADTWKDLLNNCDIFHEWLEAIYPNTKVEDIKCSIDNKVDIDDFKKWWNTNAPGTDDISGNLPNAPGLPWSECVGPYCRTKPGWDKGGVPGTPGYRQPGKTVDYKTTGYFGIIAKRRREDNG